MITNKIQDALLKDSSIFGGLLFYLILIIFGFLINKIYWSMYLSIGFLLILLFVIPLRLLFFRERPKRLKYNGLLERIDASSFPSLHSSRITLIYISLVKYFSLNISLKIFFFVILLLVLGSRVYLKKHYLSDLLGGAIIGIFVSLILNQFL